MSIINTIREQGLFDFTGKINVILAQNGQYVGTIFQKEGQLINAKYKNGEGQKALFNLVVDDLEKEGRFNYIVEPEVIEDQGAFQYSFDFFSQKIQAYYREYKTTKNLRPPPHLKLFIEKQFIIEGDDVSSREFDLLGTLSEYSLVSDIYKKSHLREYDITHALISLRKKRAIKVTKVAHR